MFFCCSSMWSKTEHHGFARGYLFMDHNDGTFSIATPAGTQLGLPNDNEVVIDESEGQLSLDIGGDGKVDIMVPSGSMAVDNGDGAFSVDADNDGIVDVIVPQESQVMLNEDGSITTTTTNGAVITTQKNDSAKIIDDGEHISLDSHGDGILDIAEVTNNVTLSVNEDKSISIDIGSDGTNDVTVEAGENVSITTDGATDEVSLGIGNDGVKDLILNENANAKIIISDSGQFKG